MKLIFRCLPFIGTAFICSLSVFSVIKFSKPLKILEISSIDDRDRRHTRAINFLCSYNKTSGLKRPTIKYNQTQSLQKSQLNAFSPICVMSLLPLIPNSIQSHPPAHVQVTRAEITELSVLCTRSFFKCRKRHSDRNNCYQEKHLYTQKTAPCKVMGEVPGLGKRQKGCRESQIFIVVSMDKKRRGRAPVLQA